MSAPPRDADVLVVGSGAGGAAAAWALAQAGVRVVLLEAGPEYDPFSDYRLARNDWEVSRFPEKVATESRHSFAPLQPLDDRWRHLRSWSEAYGVYVTEPRRVASAYHHVVGLGGTTLHFTGEAHRMNPAAMRMRSRFGVAADWPVSYDELEPFYAEAERIMGVAGPDGDSMRPRSSPYLLPAHRLSYASQRIAAACRALGLGFGPNPYAALSRPYDGRPGCNYCGQCLRGCPRIDKGSADVTFIAKARASGNCAIVTECRALRIERGAGDRIAAVLAVDEAGAQHRVAAKAVVLACGAVETPRLLLASDGLANESGEVGRNFMETTSWVSSALHPDELGSHRGLPADGISWHYNAPDAIPGVIGGCRFTSSAPELDLAGPVNYARRVVRGWGLAHKRQVRDAFGRALSVLAIGESLPNAGSFVDLDPDKRDAQGIRLARIHSHLDDGEIRRIDFMAKASRAVLDAAGAGRPFEEFGTYDSFSATHVFGTCRMGDDPVSSVVDRNGRSHRWRNLWIADASVFPSSGGGESPSLTISALAIRTARALAARARQGEL